MKRFLSGLLTAALTAGLLVPAAVAAEPGFSDVPANGALADEVAKAADYGLMNGYNATTFGYSDPMTRAQFAAVLVRMMGWDAVTPQTPSYSDVPASLGWYSAIETAASVSSMVLTTESLVADIPEPPAPAPAAPDRGGMY